MFSIITLFSIVAPFAAVVLADNSTTANSTQFQIEVIEANFQNAGLVPSLLNTFDPVALLNVSFNNVGLVAPGQNLTISDVKDAPSLQVIAANASVVLNGTYTLAMVDADIVGSNETSQTRHWLANNVTINGTSLDFKDAKNITAYAGPDPAAGSGPHRYVVLLYTQPGNFTPPSNLSSSTPVGSYNFPAYVNSTGLEGPVAGFYFQVEQGVASASISATQAVVTSTLPVPTATGSSAAKASQSGAASSVVYQSSASLGLIGVLASFFL
jgi:phosphatidylethanolamine-binding protein (PEBP) family uncharacterized protein